MNPDSHNRNIPRSHFKNRLSNMLVILTISIFTFSATAQDEDDIDRTYGEGNQSKGAYSINGTGVLADMFRNKGSEIFYSRILGAPTRRADAVLLDHNTRTAIARLEGRAGHPVAIVNEGAPLPVRATAMIWNMDPAIDTITLHSPRGTGGR